MLLKCRHQWVVFGIETIDSKASGSPPLHPPQEGCGMDIANCLDDLPTIPVANDHPAMRKRRVGDPFDRIHQLAPRQRLKDEVSVTWRVPEVVIDDLRVAKIRGASNDDEKDVNPDSFR